ncbi:unnamed protein product [Amoebophrya sp. A25]|nr:unnamed protein product [Amoebophrya sp. A25]|eukprot:GSA25T00004498001.1
MCLEDGQREKIYHAVKAHRAVEFETFTDSIMKISKRYLIRAREDWILEHVRNDLLRADPCEDPRTERKRVTALHMQEKMEKYLKELAKIS